MATQDEIARLVGLHFSSVCKILHGRIATFRKETIRRVRRVARELGYTLPTRGRSRARPSFRGDPTHPTQIQIARRLGLSVASVCKILNRQAGAFREETIQAVFRVAHAMGYDLGRLKHADRRDHRRRARGLPIDIAIYLEDGTLYDRGRAVLRDVSLSGALLGGFVLPVGSIPLKPHRIGIRLLDGPLKGVEILGRPVRLAREMEGLALAIEFVQTRGVDLRVLRKIVGCKRRRDRESLQPRGHVFGLSPPPRPKRLSAPGRSSSPLPSSDPRGFGIG